MAKRQLPSKEVLRQLLDYDPETGVLRWKARGPEWFQTQDKRGPEWAMRRWNKAYAGKEAFTCIETRGYRCGAIQGQACKAHRVIWKMVTGNEPDTIDHINGTRADNRWTNLRNVTADGNARNAKKRSDNVTGITGIQRHIRSHGHPAWRVEAADVYLGIYDCIGQAIRARREAERRHGFHPNHGRAA